MWPQREKVSSENLVRPTSSVAHTRTHTPLVSPLFLTVPEESSKLAGIGVVVQGHQEVFIELEGSGELLDHLPHTVQKLCENWRGLLLLHGNMATPLGELVAK